MLHVTTFENLQSNAQDCVVVIGNFDGVHKGHQKLLEAAKEKAANLNKKLAVLTFEPHPRELFRPDEPPCRISPPALKIERLEKCGVEVVYALPFDWNFASQSAEGFVQNILINGLKAAHVIVGFDFKFGQLRKGTPETIKDAGITVTIIEEVLSQKGEEISSSRIRQLLRHGNIDEANNLLGWNWEIHGEVVKGDQRGRELGYPTANMMLGSTIHPAYGIYACTARILGQDEIYKGACNIGIRPMFEVKVAQVEAYIFDFNQEIYGETLCVTPVVRLRGEAKFSSIDDLIAQMDKDCEQAKSILK